MDVLIHAVQHLLAQQDLVFHVALDLCFGSSQLIVHSLQFLEGNRSNSEHVSSISSQVHLYS